MTASKFIRKLLKLKDVIVARFEFRVRNGEFHLWVKPLKNGALCPECRRRGRILRTMDHRLWQDVPICGWSILFHYRPREIICLFRSIRPPVPGGFVQLFRRNLSMCSEALRPPIPKQSVRGDRSVATL